MSNLVILNDGAPPRIVQREAVGVANREDMLRDLLFDHPAMLPVHDIDPGYGSLISVAKELVIPGVGRIDALLVDEHGRLVIVECKLWRNPQARREVVGQILDYARELAHFSYEDLQRQISAATKRPGNVLYELVRDSGATIDEARLVDQVSRDLAAGRFLLLIVGDGITEGTSRIGEYLNGHANLGFSFGMIEMPHYRFTDSEDRERVVVQPRVLVKTTNIERLVIRNEAMGVSVSRIEPEPETRPRAAGTKADPEMAQQWRAFAERFQAELRLDDPGQPPPRIAGHNWMRMDLPGDVHVTLWRSLPQRKVGIFLGLKGGEGLALYERLIADREAIDREFEDAGLPGPVWSEKSDQAAIELEWSSPTPWDGAEEDRQIALLASAANQFANSLRPRLLVRADA
ncbi:hypothetical protein [Sphingomonas colocasiae]|uniref:DUF4268 domain-containing protein n=1 Tax=Sphingomonas colocasiae TaxID=1848973 RepID=A0ABS7PW33_9SPHN|nr:hypothetical protein [Sphingomonas colocasiae]MBY8825493.1 hypothetical protein [Sphingomonas colocasiae]